MHRTRTRTRHLSAMAAAALLAVPALAGCTGDDSPTSDMSPDEVLELAREKLTETSGVELHLKADDLPSGVSGITEAEGVATSAPAFDGTITVMLSGTSVDVPVIAVDDEVHAQLPFAPGWNLVDPAEYGAPDPAGLIDPDDGFPGLLAVTDDAEAGDSVRGGKDNREVLTTYTGTVDGADMKKVIPSSAGDTFEVEWQVTEDGELREAVLKGVFYADSEEMTYTVNFADYGTSQDITAP